MELREVESLKLPTQEGVELKFFLQLILNRAAVGNVRYGPANRRQKYMSKLGKEFKEYKKSGNAEQLVNIAVYAFLEFYAPENKKLHFDNTAKSVTREE